LSRASHNGAELIDGTGSDGGSLCKTGLTTTVLAAGLKFERKKSFSVLYSLRLTLTTDSVRIRREWKAGEEVPGQSGREHAVASPCGSLSRTVSNLFIPQRCFAACEFIERRVQNSRFFGMVWLCLIAYRHRITASVSIPHHPGPMTVTASNRIDWDHTIATDGDQTVETRAGLLEVCRNHIQTKGRGR
jgi:hypothetical protein